jgi:hypothetical protein
MALQVLRHEGLGIDVYTKESVDKLFEQFGPLDPEILDNIAKIPSIKQWQDSAPRLFKGIFEIEPGVWLIHSDAGNISEVSESVAPQSDKDLIAVPTGIYLFHDIGVHDAGHWRVTLDSTPIFHAVSNDLIIATVDMSLAQWNRLTVGDIIINAGEGLINIVIATGNSRAVYPGAIYKKTGTNTIQELGGLMPKVQSFTFSFGTSNTPIAANAALTVPIPPDDAPKGFHASKVIAITYNEGGNYGASFMPSNPFLNIAIKTEMGNHSIIYRNMTSSAFTLPAYGYIKITYYI